RDRRTGGGVVGAVDQSGGSVSDRGQVAGRPAELYDDVCLRGCLLVEDRGVRGEQTRLPDVDPVDEHELAGLLHTPDRVRAVREAGDAVDDLLRATAAGLVGADGLFEDVVDVDVDVAL